MYHILTFPSQGALSSPISDPILEFYDDADLFPMTSNLSSDVFASDASKFDSAALSVLLDPPQPEPDYRFLIDPPQPFDLPLMSTAEFCDPALSCSFFNPGGIGVVGASDYVAVPEMVGFQADNCGGLYGMDSMQGVFSTTEMQEALSEKQMRGFGSPSVVTVNSSVGSLDDATFKVERLSVEEKKERINRYLKKRNERNFRKKIKVGIPFSFLIFPVS
ncbi:hypothetical protein QJS04_geneDACA002305 [Acorus gramineus]|uniref:CCT domain-containing protein n=1 Tax=Acorus gramineus TaxID=55184 RepID=A0AAV9A8L5_ACOGR|nr:hypothetical protein QJS04_geneDACA002305 [Acorus gramineus]